MSARASRAIEACLGGLGGLALLAMMAVTVIDVAGRGLLDRPLPGGFELTEILLALMIFLGLPLVSMRGGHVTITLTDPWFVPRATIVGSLSSGIFREYAAQSRAGFERRAPR